MRTGHTLTRHFSLDTRQHEIMGVDLGEGPPRKMLVLTLALYLLWGGGALLIFGLPDKLTFSLYFTPPGVVAYYGARRSKGQPRRWNITVWALTLRYHLVGHRPIINGGRRAASRSEWIPRRGRWGDRVETLLALPGFTVLDPLFGVGDEPAEGAGPAIPLQATVRLYGPDRVHAAHRRHSPRSRRSTQGV
jgi:hypothetical protein